MRRLAHGPALITFVLAEAELELVPPDLRDAPSVLRRSRARRRVPEHLLLDQAQDHEAMKRLQEGDRRGRPDITHVWLLLVLDGLVNRRGQARVLIHTRHNELIRVSPETRLMRSQPKFYQLAEDLLRQGEVPLGKPLLRLERGRTLESVVAECQGTKVLMDVGGESGRADRFRDLASQGDLAVVTGGFPRGPFRQAQRAWFDHVIRVADEELTVWSAMVPVLAGCEDATLAPKG